MIFLRSERGGLPPRSAPRPRQLDPLHDQRELRGLDHDGGQATLAQERWPKTPFLKTLRPHRESVAIPIHNAYTVTSFRKEDEQVAAQRIVAKHVPN